MGEGRIRVLSTGARVTGGIFCLFFALHTWSWIVYDISEQGLDVVWRLWTGAAPGVALESMPATSAADPGLGLLQLAAVFAAFTGAWSAGGLLTATCALTFAYRLPVIWFTVRHEESSPWYAVQDFFHDNSMDVALITCGWVVLFTVPLAIVLLAGTRPWPPAPGPYAANPYAADSYGAGPYSSGPYPAGPYAAAGPAPEPPLAAESPQRPTRAGAVVTALCLAVVAAFGVGWNLYTAAESGGETWRRLFTGEQSVFQLLDLAPAWRWTTLALVGAVGALLAATRRVSARGFGLGVVIAVLPEAVAALWRYIDTDRLLELGDGAQGMEFFSRLEVALVLVGGLAVIAFSTRPGVAVPPPGAEPAPGAQPVLQVTVDPYPAQPYQQQPYQQAQPPPYPPQQPGVPPAPPGY